MPADGLRPRPPWGRMSAPTAGATEPAHIRHTSLPIVLPVGLRHLWKLAIGFVVIVVLVGAMMAATGAANPTGKLRLDGVQFRPELALTSATRSVGLMNRRRAPADGMLFVFPYETTGGFWMKSTLVPLRIVFFNSEGRRVRQLSMTPCRTDSCPIYSPGRRYRFALELRASDTRAAKQLGPVGELRRLSRLAS